MRVVRFAGLSVYKYQIFLTDLTTSVCHLGCCDVAPLEAYRLQAWR